jgi:hypothetical protein
MRASIIDSHTFVVVLGLSRAQYGGELREGTSDFGGAVLSSAEKE